jgi:hypothetical protein
MSMPLTDRLSAWWRRRKAIHRAGLAVAAGLARQEPLLAQQRFDALRAQSVARNPLLAFGAKVFSQNDEDGLIEEICRRIDLGASGNSGSFVELGVGDGAENNTLNLLVQGWRGVWLGGVALASDRLSERLRFRQCWIDGESLVPTLREELAAAGIAHVDMASLDLDGNDWHFAQAMLDAAIRPALFVVEYNATFRPGTHWVMPYDAKHQWDGSAYFGASLAAFNALFDAHGYRLVACNLTGANAFFVRREFDAAFADVPANWRALYMPPNYLPYPGGGHPHGPRFIAAMLKGG